MDSTPSAAWVKPYATFPLSLHGRLRLLFRKHKGKFYYFGRPENWKDGLKKYEHDWPCILRGEKPGGVVATPTIELVANKFLEHQLARQQRKEIGLENYDDIRRSMGDMLEFFGRNTPSLDIGPEQFAKYRHLLSGKLGVDTLDRRINHVRMMSNWASDSDNGLLARPIRFGGSFERVKIAEKRACRREKQRKDGKRSLREHVGTILTHYNTMASDPRKGKYAKIGRSMFLLGLNAGYGNKDVSSLQRGMIDFEKRIIAYDRVKTGALRIVPLWKITTNALREAIALRPKARREEYEDYVFLTRTGEPWVRTTAKPRGDGSTRPIKRDAVAEEFGKVLKSLGIKRPGLNFYAVRHTFYGVAGGAKDPEARKLIAGHASEGMEQWYEQNENEMLRRVRDVVNHVYRKLNIKQVAGNPAASSSVVPVPVELPDDAQGS